MLLLWLQTMTRATTVSCKQQQLGTIRGKQEFIHRSGTTVGIQYCIIFLRVATINYKTIYTRIGTHWLLFRLHVRASVNCNCTSCSCTVCKSPSEYTYRPCTCSTSHITCACWIFRIGIFDQNFHNMMRSTITTFLSHVVLSYDIVSS